MSFAVRGSVSRCIRLSNVVRLAGMRTKATLSPISTLSRTLKMRSSVSAQVSRYSTEANDAEIKGSRSSKPDEETAPVIDFGKMKEIALQPGSEYVIVDVREPDEFSAGHIPHAINIPVKSAPGALGLHEDEFKLRYGYDKPSTDKTLVFYCLAGVRANIAEELAYTFGYNHRLNYAGSFGDWVGKNGAIETPPAAEQQPKA